MAAEYITPPGTCADQPTPPPAPVARDGGFLRPKNWREGPFHLVPENPAPVDERALSLGIHIVLPIAQIAPQKKWYSLKKNGHHGAGFPEEHPGLQGDDLRVIRWARVQEGLRILHWRYHAHYDGVIMPDNEHENFLATFLYSTGYVPSESVDVSSGVPRIIRNSPSMLEDLHKPGILHQQEGMRWRIGFYFGRYVMKHGLSAIKEAEEVSRFLEAKDPLQRYRLGHDVIRLAAEALIDPVESVYQSARATGQISLAQPPHAVRFMMKHFDERQRDYFDTMQLRLSEQLAA